MQRKTTSLKIEESLWKEVKKFCIDKDFEISDYIENLIRKDLKIILENKNTNRTEARDFLNHSTGNESRNRAGQILKSVAGNKK